MVAPLEVCVDGVIALEIYNKLEYISLKDKKKTAIGLQWNKKKLDVQLQLTGYTPSTSQLSNQLLFPH